MRWSISWGRNDSARGIWQYSQRSWARRHAKRTRASSIPARRPTAGRAKYRAGLRLEEVDQHADVEVALELATFGRGEGVLLILAEKLVEALAIVRVELNAEQRARRRGRDG